MQLLFKTEYKMLPLMQFACKITKFWAMFTLQISEPLLLLINYAKTKLIMPLMFKFINLALPIAKFLQLIQSQ